MDLLIPLIFKLDKFSENKLDDTTIRELTHINEAVSKLKDTIEDIYNIPPELTLDLEGCPFCEDSTGNSCLVGECFLASTIEICKGVDPKSWDII